MTRMETLKAIEEPTITVEFAYKAVEAFNELIKRNEAIDGIPDEGYGNLNRCPICDSIFGLTDNFCGTCGQRVRFTKSDVVPL